MQIESLRAGSIIVRLRIAVQDPGFPVDASSFAPVLSYLYNGSVLLVDQQNSAVEGNFKITIIIILIAEQCWYFDCVQHHQHSFWKVGRQSVQS